MIMIITRKTPKLDLHGEVEAMVAVLVDAFIKDNYLQNKKTLRIIHGRTGEVLKKEVHRVLKQNPMVLTYKLNNWNLGETLVEIKSIKDK